MSCFIPVQSDTFGCMVLNGEEDLLLTHDMVRSEDCWTALIYLPNLGQYK